MSLATAATRINEWGMIDSSGLSDDSPYSALLDAQVHEDLTPTLQQLRRRVDDISRDGRLTDQAGKPQARRLAGSQVHDKLEQLHTARRRKLEIDAANAKVPARLPNEMELAKELNLPLEVVADRMRELREAIRQMGDPVIQRATIMEGASNNDVVLLVAVAGFHPLVSPVRRKDIDEAIAEWITTQTPPAALAVREALQMYDANHKTAQTRVGELTGISASNSHARSAAKEVARPPMFDEGKEADADSRLP